MNIHEYQAKELFRSYNIPVSSGSVAYSAGEIERAVNEVEGPVWVVKAQIHAGGRGKGGGVKVVSSKEDALHLKLEHQVNRLIEFILKMVQI